MPRSILTNYYIQKQQLDKEFLEGLRVRKIDEKFLYIGEQQANAWFNLCNSPEYEYYRNSKKLLERTAKDFALYCNDNVNVIVLGPGNVLKEKLVVEALQENHAVDLFFVDTSKEILNIAVKNIADSGALREVFIADLMNSKDIARLSRYARRQYNATSFFTCLGNTVGNYPQAMMLKTIRNAMAPGDKILIDVSCKLPTSAKDKTSQVDSTMREYNSTYNIQLFQMLLSEVGIAATDGAIEFDFGVDDIFPQMDVVKKFFRFTRSKTITYQGEAMYFAKDERILVAYSNKYTFEFLERLLTAHGLRIVENAQDDTRKYRQLLCELA